MSLILLVGPVAAGKTTLRQRLVTEYGMLPFKTCTTRKMRDEERGDVVPQYHFLTHDDFMEGVSIGDFYEHEEFAGKCYGTRKADLDVALSDDNHWVGVVDVRGAISLKRDFPSVLTIFIEPPSVEELKRRVSDRGTETSQEQMTRLQIALERELPLASKLDFRVVNDNLDETVEKIRQIILEFY